MIDLNGAVRYRWPLPPDSARSRLRLTTPPATLSAPPFGRDRLARISQLEGWHFWFAGRRLLLDQLWQRHLGTAPRRVLEIGCGNGRFSQAMAARGHDVVGLDLRAEGLRAIRATSDPLKALQADAGRLPLQAETFDVAVLMDILEHADDGAVLAEAWRVLRPGGALILTVPALPWLWSFRDEAAGHRRRYTRRSLTGVVRTAGFECLETRYYQCLLLPLVALTRVVGRKVHSTRELEEQPGPVVNAVFGSITRAEVHLGPVVRWPWGSSLAAVCRKP
jgi:SAM-dependent methyltransferase